MSTDQIAAFKQFGDRASRDTSFVNAITSDAREAHDLASRLSSTTARSERADASLAERTAFSERVSSAYEKGEAISIDIAQDPHNIEMFTRYAEQYGGNSASARVLLDAELARQSLRPNRAFSDGTAMPTSFGDLAVQHQRDVNDPALAPDIKGTLRANLGDVRRFGGTPQPIAPAGDPSNTMRDTIREEGEGIRATAADEQASFQHKAEITTNLDGTLASKRSLMKQAGKQVIEDGGNLFDNAKDAVKGALRK
jgi:conjugal transfer mating pair stabilization protein TraG